MQRQDATTPAGRLELSRQHAPNNPARGVPPLVDRGVARTEASDPVQCRKCLQTYPCETRQLLDVVRDLQRWLNDAISAEFTEDGEDR